MKKKLSIEKIAVDKVVQFEQNRGWQASPVEKGKGYDVESKKDADVRYIEVKGLSAGSPYTDFWMAPTFLRCLGENISKFYLYIVYDLPKDPKIVIVSPNVLFKNMRVVSQLSFKANKKTLEGLKPEKIP